ncbi:hypothetical protein AB0J83_31755 [Actinoplanes sp. NPDC049596]|uniref:hypothetical protein n=1 Tax=unclassified Actinoplanes TaxID=2626549 RepID=UPI0034282B0E
MAVPHRVVALVVPNVVAFGLSIAAQIFGHPAEAERYSFQVRAEEPGERAWRPFAWAPSP